MQVYHLHPSAPFHPDPLPLIPDKVVSRAGDKFKLGGDVATLGLKVRCLDAEVLSSGTVAGEPASSGPEQGLPV